MRILKHLCIAIAAICALASCNSRSSAIGQMVDELNSPVFRAQEAKTGLFDDSKAEISGNQLVITFLCRPFISLATVNRDELPQLKLSAINEFKANLVNEKFRKGIEALHKENMTILLVWQDINGHSIKLPVDPADILRD